MDTSPDCCSTWPSLRQSLNWFEFEDEPGVYVMPCIPGTNFRVKHCPICGEARRSAIWNSNTHPRQGD